MKLNNKHKLSNLTKGGLTVLISVAIIFTIVKAGSLTPTSSPTATSYTLTDIYNRLNTNAAATEGNHDFTPGASPAGTLYTLTQIYDKIPTIVADTVKLGTTYLGVDGTLTPDGGTAAVADLFNGKTAHLTADWNLDSGTLNLACNTATFDGAGNIVTDVYDGAGTGLNRWCMTDSGDAATSDVLSGKIAWVDGVARTGAMANVGAQTITPSTANQTITQGYHDGTGYCAGDADLVAGNILSGVTIFGVAGTFPCGEAITYEGQVYSFVSIGTQCWLKENLNVGTRIAGASAQTNNATIEKYCYGDSEANCDTDGGLYQWDEAMGYVTTAGAQGICPTGTHIPTDAEQHTLDNYLATGTCDPARSGAWDCDPAGTALKVGGSSGFAGILAGYRYTDGSVSNRGTGAHFWSSSESGTSAWNRYLHSSTTTVARYSYSKAYGFSVRCLKN